MRKKTSPPHGKALAPSKVQINPFTSFVQHVKAAMDQYCTINIRWYYMEAMASVFETNSYDYGEGMMHKDGILRDMEGFDWSDEALIQLCEMVALPAIALDAAHALGPAAQDMADSWKAIRDGHKEAAGLLMEGYLGTGIRIVMAVDPDALLDLANIVAFHALDSAYLAALDARERLRNPLQIDLRSLESNKVPRNGALASCLREEWDRATYVHEIFNRTDIWANKPDTEWASELGLNERALEAQLGWAVNTEDLLGLLALLLEEGKAATANLPALLERHRSKRWSLQEVHRWLGTPAIPLLWNSVLRAGHVHSAVRRVDVGVGIAGEGKRDRSAATESWAEQIVRDTNAGDPPSDLLATGFEVSAELPRLLCHRLRIDVVQDEDAIPRKYAAAAVRERARGNADPCWHEPYTFEKVVEGLEHEGKAHGSRFLVEASTEGNSLIEDAIANPDDQKKRRVLVEAQGRLWFRLRL